jgi:hypothetical protein
MNSLLLFWLVLAQRVAPDSSWRWSSFDGHQWRIMYVQWPPLEGPLFASYWQKESEVFRVKSISKHAITSPGLRYIAHQLSCWFLSSTYFTSRPSRCEFCSSVFCSYVSSARPTKCGFRASWVNELQVMSEKKGLLCSQHLEDFPSPFKKTPSSHLLRFEARKPGTASCQLQVIYANVMSHKFTISTCEKMQLIKYFVHLVWSLQYYIVRPAESWHQGDRNPGICHIIHVFIIIA